MTFNADSVPELLAPGGPLAGDLDRYEDRPYQRELALEVSRLLEDGGRLAAEAPTGIGKSLAYGLPAAAWAASGQGPVVISTHTRALQNQLLELEAPRIRQAVGGELTVELLKGRANYLCRRRFEAACRDAATDGTQRLLERMRPWAETTVTGDLGETGERNPRDLQFLHLKVASDPRFCAHPDCSPRDGCFFKRARARAAQADLLVVNHALLAIHLFAGRDLLPGFEALVVDEAHAFLRVALDHLTVNAGPRRLAMLLENAPGSGGVVPGLVRDGEGASRLAALQRAVSRVEADGKTFFGKRNGARPGGDDRQRFRDEVELGDLCPLPAAPLFDALGTLDAEVRSLGSFLEREGDAEEGDPFAIELGRFRGELDGLRADLDTLLHPDPSERDRVRWKEWRGDDTFSLNDSPLEVGPRLAQALAEGPERLVFTSATLAPGTDETYFGRETGFGADLATVVYPSPFDFERQALVTAVRRGPDPRDPGWAGMTAAALHGLMEDPARKTMALFTSYRDLDAVGALLRARASGGYGILAQGPGGSAAELLTSFREAERALLLGTASFWEGVDLPGDDLEVLVLTRLPFGVPTEPRYQARAEKLEADGGNPFHDLYLPEAVLRFKQGFGRLIRRRTDRGIVAVLDPRLLGKGYGKSFARSLPLPITPAADGPALVRTAAAWWHHCRVEDPLPVEAAPDVSRGEEP